MLLAGCAASPVAPAVDRPPRPDARIEARDADGPVLGGVPGDPKGEGLAIRRVLVGPLLQSLSPRQRAKRGELTLLAIDGAPVRSTAELLQRLSDAGAGAEVELSLRFGDAGRPEPVRVTLGRRIDWAGPGAMTPPVERTAPPDGEAEGYRAWARAAVETQGLTEPVARLVDLFVRTVEARRGANTLPVVAAALADPLSAPEQARLRTASLVGGGDDPRRVFAWAADQLGVAAPRLGDAGRAEADRAGVDASGEDSAPGSEAWSEPESEPTAHAEAAARRLAAAARRSYAQVEAALAATGLAAPREAMLRLAVGMGRHGAMASHDAPGLSLEALRATPWLDVAKLLEAAAALSIAMDPAFAAGLKAAELGSEGRAPRRWRVEAVAATDDPAEPVVIVGGPGADVYDVIGSARRPVVIVDPGGDDVYRFLGEPGPVLVILDASGDDRYLAVDAEPGDPLRLPDPAAPAMPVSRSEAFGPASAVAGVSLLVDREGDDEYRGGFFSVGGAMAGVALLVDHAGDDRYDGTSFGVGAALYGFGGVIDEGGDDRYRGDMYCQAVGGPGGVGLLLEADGHDLYQANGPAPSTYGLGSTHFAMSQGVGVGMRPIDTGGVGVLLDVRGRDRYDAGEFSQGGGYFLGLGVLRDMEGADRYTGERWAQGWGCHQAVGVLQDDGGNDVYVGRTAAAQGAGWDIGAGALVDLGGEDFYFADSLSMGSAAMQGVGLLFDLGGSDTYRGGSAGVSGSNTYHHDETGAFSFSLLVDGGGDADRHRNQRSAPRGDDRVLVTGSRNDVRPARSNLHGLFVDLPEKLQLRRPPSTADDLPARVEPTDDR